MADTEQKKTPKKATPKKAPPTADKPAKKSKCRVHKPRKQVKVAKTPKAPKVPKTPKAPKAPKVPKDPKAPKAAKTPKTPKKPLNEAQKAKAKLLHARRSKAALARAKIVKSKAIKAKLAEKRKAKNPEGTVAKRPRIGKPRNYDLGNGVWRFSRSRMYKKRAIWKFVKKGPAAKNKKLTLAVKKTRPVQYVRKRIGGDKNGGFRMVKLRKPTNYYPTTPKLKKRPSRKVNFARHKRSLRKSITPGTVLIIVAGKHRGKRVVFLKQLKTGLLLVTGPFKLNRCPLRRINQIYVIATKTRLDIKKVKIPKHLNDDFFKRKRPHRPKKDEGEIFETKKETYRVSDERKKDQIKVDKQILEVIRKRPDKRYMFGYLGSMFGLRNHMYPHSMKF